MKRLFGGLKMTWGRVILFALVTGIYTGAVMLVPGLKDTSFQDIGISYEWWVIFAVILVVNCTRSREAALKCFVFFLVSQPLVYLVEVLAGALTFDLAKTYYLRIWLPMTVLTLPGGWVAFYCRKQNFLGCLILGLGNTIQFVLGVTYGICAVTEFPHHLLSALVCFGSAVVMSFGIQRSGKRRCLTLLAAAVITGCLILAVKATGRYLVSGVF